MAGTKARERPLSPHLQIYRWPLPMMMSIVHRITGAGLYFGTLLMAWWLIAAAPAPTPMRPSAPSSIRSSGGSSCSATPGRCIHHMLGGIRHLIWDTGHGFQDERARVAVARDRARCRSCSRSCSGSSAIWSSEARDDRGDDLRTPLARVRGLGSAKSGTEHFWRQRLTAVANVPLTIAFVVIVVSLLGRIHAAAQQILGSPLVAILMLLFIGSVTYHMRIGMQVIIEDYVHDEVAEARAADAEHVLHDRGRARLRPTRSSSCRSECEHGDERIKRQRAGGQRPRLSDRGSHLRRGGGRRRRLGPARGRSAAARPG